MNFEDRKTKLAYHEVGHWFVAKKLGFTVGTIRLKVNETRYGRFHEGSATSFLHPRLMEISNVDDYVLKRMAVLAAGVAAQTTVDKRSAEDIWEIDAKDDWSKFNELAYLRRGIRFPNENRSELEIDQVRLINAEACELASSVISGAKDFDCVVNYVLERFTKPNIPFAFSEIELSRVMASI